MCTQRDRASGAPIQVRPKITGRQVRRRLTDRSMDAWRTGYFHSCDTGPRRHFGVGCRGFGRRSSRVSVVKTDVVYFLLDGAESFLGVFSCRLGRVRAVEPDPGQVRPLRTVGVGCPPPRRSNQAQPTGSDLRSMPGCTDLLPAPSASAPRPDRPLRATRAVQTARAAVPVKPRLTMSWPRPDCPVTVKFA